MEELARRSGVALSRIRLMEHGELPVTGDECRRLANVLAIKPEEIHNDTPGTLEVVLLPEGKTRKVMICNWCLKAHEGEGCNPLDLPEEVR
jgi:transcriptional regulator with XRE-family HTH domain